MSKERLDEQQNKAARKDAGGFQHPIYVARLKDGPPIDYRPNPAPALAREGALPKIEVNGSSQPGATFGPVVIGTPDHVAVPCDVPECVVTHLTPKPVMTIFIEAERWVDARSFALRKLGVPEAVVVKHDDESAPTRPCPRWQVRHVGISGHPTNPMRMQARQIQNEPTKEQAEAWWKDVREL